jgi:transcriptional regulator with XRE-family HTH domain
MAGTPLDAGIRKRLVEAVAKGLNQSELAKAVGRSPGWVNKYIYGAGNATIDDILAMARFFKMSLLEFIGLPPGSEFTADEREVIDRWRSMSPKGREHFRGLLREMPSVEKEKRPRRRSA